MVKRVGEMIVLTVLLLLSGTARAADTTDCTGALTTLASCLSFVIGSVNLPSQDCCSALKPVVQTTPVCLCRLLGYGSDPSTTIPSNFNQTLAKQLPSMCAVAANEEHCPALVAGVPVPAPGTASGPAPPPSAGGPAAPKDAAASLVSSVPVMLICLAAAFFAYPSF